MNFDRFRRYKKWSELSQAEKIEQLKMEQEYPYYTWHMLLFMVALVVILSLYLMGINTAKIDDLYNQTGITMSQETNQTITLQYEKISSIGNNFGILLIIFVGIWLVYLIWHQWKWRHFRKRIKRKGEINNEKLDW